MKLTTITVFFAILSCLAIWHTLLRLKREHIGLRFALVWIIMWVVIGITSLFPSLLDYFSALAMMQSRMFFLLVVSIFVLFALVFFLMSNLEVTKRNQAKIIQTLAITNYKLDELARSETASSPKPQGDEQA
jgi:hypothetical protein